MEINRNDVNGITIFSITDTIDLYTAGDLKEKIYQDIEKGFNKIIINFEKVTYIDSSGIGVLLSCLSKSKQRGGDLKLTNLPPNVLSVIKISKFDRIFEIYDNLDKAIQSFNTPSIPSLNI